MLETGPAVLKAPTTELVDGDAVLRVTYPLAGHPFDTAGDLLTRFCRLLDAPAARVRSFAARHGALNLDLRGLPRRAVQLGLPFDERVEWYHQYARLLLGVLRMAHCVRCDTSADPEDEARVAGWLSHNSPRRPLARRVRVKYSIELGDEVVPLGVEDGADLAVGVAAAAISKREDQGDYAEWQGESTPSAASWRVWSVVGSRSRSRNRIWCGSRRRRTRISSGRQGRSG